MGAGPRWRGGPLKAAVLACPPPMRRACGAASANHPSVPEHSSWSPMPGLSDLICRSGSLWGSTRPTRQPRSHCGRWTATKGPGATPCCGLRAARLQAAQLPCKLAAAGNTAGALPATPSSSNPKQQQLSAAATSSSSSSQQQSQAAILKHPCGRRAGAPLASTAAPLLDSIHATACFHSLAAI